jgi:hypothetical protein
MVLPALVILLAISGAVTLLLPATVGKSSEVGSWVVPESSEGTAIDQAARHAGADPSWLATVSSHLQSQEYHASPSGEGFQAPNRAQNLRTTFDRQGIHVVPRVAASADGWRFGWETTAWGRPGHMQPASLAEPAQNGSRITYERKGWSEWYENGADGLEQGFTVNRRPPGPGPLRVEEKFQGDLRPELQDGAVDLLDARGVSVLRYDKLVVQDASGRVLPSWLSLDGRALAIQVDDHGARYPLTIDPLLTSPAWTAESDQDGAVFGVSVATAGDVNGDGFSDVIVGASEYDNGQVDEGRAFVFLGSPSGLAGTPVWSAESNQTESLYGSRVAPAGDVNRDGYSDILVGAYEYDNGQTDEGRASLYLGSPAGPAATAAWTAEGNQSGAFFGTSVATAGDVNNDGFADVIVGAPGYNNGQMFEGRAFVYLGTAGGLATSATWMTESNYAGAVFGHSVATAGDVNGDGFSDVIVGAYGYDNGETEEGRVFVYHGSPVGLATTSAWSDESNLPGSWFGFSVATAGDVNGDGFSDVIIGAPSYSGGEQQEGAAFVYEGSAAGLEASFVWFGQGNQAVALLGWSVATAGDVNGDGFSDVIVSVDGYDGDQIGEGRAIVYHGTPGGLSGIPGWIAEGNQDGAGFGFSVATAGDVNGDGFSDVIVGARLYTNGQFAEGRAFAYHGSAGGLANTATWGREGNQVSAEFGWTVGSAGDVNGDGYSDVIVGADAYDNGQNAEGRAWLYLGGAGGPGSSPAWIVEGNQDGALLGYSLATAGDVNGDGFSDVIVGVAGYDCGQTDEGMVWVYHGSAAGLSGNPSWVVEGNQAGAFFGSSVASAGDVNGDGFSDVVIGAYLYDNGQMDEGMAFVFHGSASGLRQVAQWAVDTGQSAANLSRAATAGDVNGDGYSDVIIGAHDYDNGQTNEGQAWVFHGSASGLAGFPSWEFQGNQASARLGYSLGTAGDVNGDGFSDVIVGASGFTFSLNSEGRVFVFHGSPSGLLVNPSWLTDGGQALAAWGRSVATAGDVNGDGYSDIIAAADGWDNGQVNEGEVWAYYGSPTGISGAPFWTVDSNQDGAELGQVAPAGDVNGDGYADVIIGAYKYDNGESNEGKAFVYLGNEGDGLDRIARQARANDSAPIDLLGLSDSGSSFRLKALGRTPAGRGRVRLQWEVKPAGVPFDGTGLVTGPAFTTSAPTSAGSSVPLSALVTALTPEILYHWRLRVLSDSPFFPRSRWLWHPGNASSEGDLRTGESTIGISSSPQAPPLLLEHSVPNPFTTSTRFTYTLPKADHLRLAIYDVAGRQVAVLSDGAAGPGHYQASWNGHSASGNPLAAGVYFLRCEFAGAIETQKIVLKR